MCIFGHLFYLFCIVDFKKMPSRLEKVEKRARVAPTGEYFEIQYDDEMRKELSEDYEKYGNRWKINLDWQRNKQSNKLRAHILLVDGKLVTTYVRDKVKPGKVYISLKPVGEYMPRNTF